MCDDLLQVIKEESSRLTRRFSLRLSSQLLRGVTRIYEKKASIFLAELCMLNATILKLANHRFDAPEKKPKERRIPKPLLPAGQFEENQLHVHDNVEELLQNSGNVIANIADITLRVIPDDTVKPISDGFGIEDEQIQSMFLEPEEMRHARDKSSVMDVTNLETSALQVSTEASVQVEHGSVDVTMAPENKSLATVPEIVGDVVLDVNNVSKISDEKDADKRESPATSKVIHSTPLVMGDNQDKGVKKAKKLSFGVPIAERIDETLESLEPVTPAVKRRRKTSKLVVDTQIILASGYVRSRLVSNIDIACEFQDVAKHIDCVLPPEQYFKKPAHSFALKRQLPFTSHYIRNFQRNLFPIEKSFEEREREFILAGAEADKRVAQETSIVKADTIHTMARVSALPSHKRPRSFIQPKEDHEEQVEVESLADISNLPIQVLHSNLETVVEEAVAPSYRISKSQTIKFRAHYDETGGLVYEMESMRPSPKIARLDLEDRAAEAHQPVEKTPPIADVHQQLHPVENLQQISSPPADDSHRRLSIKNSQAVNEMLLEAGLADKLETRVERSDTDTSEIPLGSLDRTAVSLGESVATTDSRKFLREKWDSEATLLRIIKEIKRSLRPLTLDRLLACGPQHVYSQRMVATACFTSLLRLKQTRFIKILKQDHSNDIKFIQLEDRLYEEELI